MTGRELHRVGMGLVSEYDLGPEMPAFRGRVTADAGMISDMLSPAAICNRRYIFCIGALK